MSNENRKIKKHYPTTLSGLVSALYDKATGNDTYIQQDTLSAPNDQDNYPDFDNRTQAERNQDYLNSPVERAKQQIANGRSPLQGVYRTILPSAVGAAAVTYLPGLVQRVPGVISNGIDYIIKNPIQTIAKDASKKALVFGKDLAKGYLGAKAVDWTTNAFTGKDYGELISPYLGVSEETADFLNPGWLMAGNKTIENLVDTKKRLQQVHYTRKRYQNYFENLEQNTKKIINDLNEKYYQSRRSIRDKINKENNIVYNIGDKLIDITQQQKALKDRRIGLRRLVNGEGHPAIEYYSKENIPLGLNKSQLNKGQITFQSPLSQQQSSELNYKNTSNGQINAIKTILSDRGLIGQRLHGNINYGMPIISGNTDAIQNSIRQYISGLEGIMDGDGVVSGSLVSYGNGLIKGTIRDGVLSGPADTEIYTTAERLPGLIQKLEFQGMGKNSVDGLKGVSKYTFRNNDYSHSGIDTEINIIQSDANGNAKGKLAHQIYRALYPEKYSQMAYDYTMSRPDLWHTTNGIIPFGETSLPIKAEELFQLVRNPKNMQRHLYTDMIGQETFTRDQNKKAVQRFYSALFDESPAVQEMLSDGISNVGKINLGSNFKLGTELYPNLSFGDISANKQFLKQVYNIPDELAEECAKNEQLMKNAFNLYNYSHSTGVRMVGNDVITDVTSSGKPYHDARFEMFYTNGSLGGGNGSGGGGNNAALNPFGGWHPGSSNGDSDARNIVGITQRHLTYNPDKIKTPMDLVDQLKHLSDDLYGDGDYLATFDFTKQNPVKYNLDRILKLREQSLEQDKPIFFNRGLYGLGYIGSYDKPIASGANVITREYHNELGSLFKELLEEGVDREFGAEYSGLVNLIQDEESKKHIETRLASLAKKIQDEIPHWQSLSKEDRIKAIQNMTRNEVVVYPNGLEFSMPRNLIKDKRLGSSHFSYKNIFANLSTKSNEKEFNEAIDELIQSSEPLKLVDILRFTDKYKPDAENMNIKILRKKIQAHLKTLFNEKKRAKGNLIQLNKTLKQLDKQHDNTLKYFNDKNIKYGVLGSRMKWKPIYKLQNKYQDFLDKLKVFGVGYGTITTGGNLINYLNKNQDEDYYDQIVGRSDKKPSRRILRLYPDISYEDENTLFDEILKNYNDKHK